MLTGSAPRSVSQSVLIYAAAFAAAGATPFLLLPILTKYLSPKEFGEATAFLILAAMIGNVAGLSSHGFVSVRYFKSGSTEFKSIVTNAVAVVCAAHILVAILIPVLFPQLRRLIDLPLGLTLFAVLAALFVSLNLIFLAIYQSSGRPMLYLTARLLQGIIEIVMCIGLIFLVTPDSSSRTLSYVVAVAASVGLGIRYCLGRDYLGFGVAKKNLKALLVFGLPMIPHIVMGTAITYLDRVVVSFLLGVESLGIYMVGMQIGMAMMVVIEPLSKGLVPWLFAQLSKNDPRIRLMVVRNTYLLHLGLVVIGFVVVVLSHLFFDQVIDAQYAVAKTLVPWMVAGFVFQGMYYSVVIYIFFAEKTWRLSAVSSVIAVMGCFLSYILVSNFGLVGAGASFALNNLALFTCVWFAASRVVSMPWLLRGGRRERL